MPQRPERAQAIASRAATARCFSRRVQCTSTECVGCDTLGCNNPPDDVLALTNQEKWDETWGYSRTMMGILGFAWFDCWPMLGPVVAELFSFDAVGDIWAETGFEGDPPEM